VVWRQVQRLALPAPRALEVRYRHEQPPTWFQRSAHRIDDCRNCVDVLEYLESAHDIEAVGLVRGEPGEVVVDLDAVIGEPGMDVRIAVDADNPREVDTSQECSRTTSDVD
jgi:hypothetical protein